MLPSLVKLGKECGEALLLAEWKPEGHFAAHVGADCDAGDGGMDGVEHLLLLEASVLEDVQQIAGPKPLLELQSAADSLPGFIISP